MGSHYKATRRDFLKTASAALTVPYIITSTALGNEDVPPASDRIVMGGIGIGNMGRGDQGAFLGRSDVQYVAVSRCTPWGSRGGQSQGRRALQEHRLPGLQRLSRTVGAHRYRCRACGHARPLARDHRDRGLSQWQGRVLPETGDADVARGALDDRSRAPLLACGLRRQPTGAGRLSRHRRQMLGRRIGHDQVDQRQRRSALATVQSCRQKNVRPTWTGKCGSVPRLGHPTTRLAVTAISEPVAAAGGPTSTTRAVG